MSTPDPTAPRTASGDGPGAGTPGGYAPGAPAGTDSSASILPTTAYREGAASPYATDAPYQQPPVNTLSLVTFVLGILGVPIAPIITGHLALNQFKDGRRESGRELGLAGLILGYVYLAFFVLWILFMIMFFGAVISTINSIDTNSTGSFT